jgi:hypothetical protein
VNAETIVAVLSAVIAAVSVFIAWRSHQSNETRDTKVEADEYLSKEIKLSLGPVNDKIAEVNSVLVGIRTSIDGLAKESETTGTRLGSLLDRTSVLETKVSVFWKNVSSDAAMILHSPDPRRKPIDLLLEAFMEHRITEPQKRDLKKYLRIIQAWEPGQTWDWVLKQAGVNEPVPEFPIRDSESTPAMLMLLSMDHVKM